MPLLCLGSLWCWPTNLQAQSDAQGMEPRVVLRVSQAVLEELIPASLDQPFEIDTEVESTKFHGAGKAVGTIDVQMQQQTRGAVFTVSVRGQTTKRFVGSHDPITFDAQGTGSFVTTARVRLDGRRFYRENTVATSEQKTKILRLCSRQRHLLGRLVRRIGWRKVCQARPKMNRYISQRVQDGVAHTLDTVCAELVQELNQLMSQEIAETLLLLDPTADSWHYHLSATEDYLQVAVGPRGAAPAANIPPAAAADIEVWIRLSAADAAMLGLASLWDNSHDLLKGLLPPEEAELLPPDAGLRAVGDWALVDVGRAR